MTLMSRSPDSEIWSVRGIGVALIASTSDAQAELAQGLLLGHAEALLLVHDHEAEVLGLDVHRQQAVGADEDVEPPVAIAREDLAGLGRRAEAVDHVHAHGQVAVAVAEGGQVLLGQDRGRHQHQHLLAGGRGT